MGDLGTCIVCVVILVIFHGCAKYAKYVPDPVKDVDQWVSNFEKQKSFSYKYEMKTNFVKVRASGDCLIGIGERILGQWEHGDEVQKFEYIGLGDIEYARKNGVWMQEPRGEESDIFTQANRMLGFDKFVYEGFNDGFLYTFKANVPFLAPDRRKEMIGHMLISKDHYLPEFIWAGLPDSSIYWTAKLSDYNTYKKIKTPVREYSHYLISSVGQAAVDLYDHIDKRLELLNVDYRINPSTQGVVVGLTEQHIIEDLQVLLRPGGLSVYVVVKEGKAATRTAYLQDNLYAPVFLSRLLFTETLVRDADIKFDQRSTPYIALRLRERLKMPQTIAFEVDGVVVATTTLDTLYKMDRIKIYPDMQYREIEILRAYIERPLGTIEIRPVGGETP